LKKECIKKQIPKLLKGKQKQWVYSSAKSVHI
jgi:hypothetical protein